MRYRHYKGGEYEVVCFATNEADLTSVVVYKSVIDGKVWVRPNASFFGFVEVNGDLVERFRRIKNDEAQGEVVRPDPCDVPSK